MTLTEKIFMEWIKSIMFVCLFEFKTINGEVTKIMMMMINPSLRIVVHAVQTMTFIIFFQYYTLYFSFLWKKFINIIFIQFRKIDLYKHTFFINMIIMAL